MGDKHVCSLCDENLEGKQHVKIVFENWPIEETVTYRRKGKERTKTRTLAKEVITALGIECLRNSEKWKDYDIDPGKVEEFFEDLRFAGKNPLFRAILTKTGAVCLATDCQHRTGEKCEHLLRLWSAKYDGLDELSCEVGHPGVVLVRRGKRELVGKFGVMPPRVMPDGSSLVRFFRSLKNLWLLAHPPNTGIGTKIYSTIFYTIPLLMGISLYTIAISPFWLGMKVKNRLALK